MREAKTVGAILLVALLPALVSFAWHFSRGHLATASLEVAQISVETARDWPQALWIDARPEPEYLEDHVPGALWLSENGWSRALPTVLDAWRPDQRVVVYCGSESCEKSASVARRLAAETGWKDIFVLEGGWEAWKSE